MENPNLLCMCGHIKAEHGPAHNPWCGKCSNCEEFRERTMLNFETVSPEDLVSGAYSLEAILVAIKAGPWTERKGKVLEWAYAERLLAAIQGRVSIEKARELAGHLARAMGPLFKGLSNRPEEDCEAKTAMHRLWMLQDLLEVHLERARHAETQPLQPGWYWLQQGDEEPQVARVEMVAGELSVITTGNVGVYSLDWLKSERRRLLGPLAMPPKEG